MDPKLLEILVCPVTKGPLAMPATTLAYPIRDDIPVMLEEEARKLTPEEVDALH